MSIKKLIAYITAIAILVLSCNITAFAADKPTVQMGATVCNSTTMVGSYTYTGSTPEGDSIYRWYASDSFFDKGTLVTGADELTFNVGKDTLGKFLTFAVVPVDINGTAGDEVCADPIMQNQGYYEDFAAGMTENIISTVTAEGYVEIQDDPAGSSDKVLFVSKEHDSSFKTEARISFDSIMSSKSVVDVQLYASDIEGTAKLFGVYSDTYGSVLELQTDSTGALYYRGEGEVKQSAVSFPQDVWNRVVIEIDGDAKTVTATINGENIIDGGVTKWRFDNDSYNNVATSFINYGNGGKVYIKNLSVINADGRQAAEADAQSLEDALPIETVSAVSLPDKGENGSSIFWKTSMPQYITADGQVTRPEYGEGDAEVILTAYIINGSYLVKKDIVVTVLEATLPPVAENVTITQNASRYVIASYDYYDENDEKEKGSILQWYVEQDGSYVPVEGANQLIFVPTGDYDGKNIRFSVTPNNEVGIIGVETFSEPYRYVYYETQKPVVEITSKGVNDEGAFEFKCKYTSPDYVAEGDTVMKWYISDTLFGDYTVIEGAADAVYMPADKSAYYKFSITPVDAEGNAGDEVAVGPFMYAATGTNQISAAEGALADIELPESTYADLELPLTTEDGASYTWVSANPQIISNDGKINRPAADAENATVTLTAYAMCGFEMACAEFTVIVNKYTTPPVVTDQKLYQESRPIKLDFVYTDADENAMGDMVYEWYYKADADSDFVLIEGANSDMYAPAKEMDGYIFIAKITPADDSHTLGQQVTTPEHTYVYQTPAKPSVEMKTTQLTALALTGDYDYINPDGIAEGDSEYSWYVADKLFGSYKQIAGAKDKSFAYDSSYDGKYVKFVVVPKDTEGIAGDAAEAKPVLIRFNPAETFDADYEITGNIDTSNLLGGTVAIATDPANPDNTALRLQRTSTKADEQSMIKYIVPTYAGSTGLIIEADLYASSDMKGTWEMFYICGANIAQTYKLWTSGTNLLSRGGTYTKPDGTVVTDSSMNVSTSFTKDTWHHIKVVMDTKNQKMLECSLNGVVVQRDMTFRTNVSSIVEIVSYFQSSHAGTGYIDNIQITPIYSDAAGGLAEADAKAVDLGVDLDAVISNLRLPAEGSINGSAITWVSSNEDVVTSKGKVNRPESAEGDKQVTLTAHVVNGNEYYTRDFNINVMRILNDDEIVAYDAANVLASYDGTLADKDIALPSKGIYGALYSWSSSDPDVISNTGKVTRYDEKKDVILDVTVTYGDFTETKQMKITVVPLTGDNLVINGGIDASSAKAQHQSANAGDGDYSTYWSSLGVDKAPYVTLDMGKVKDVNQLYIADAAKSVGSLTISASTDKSTWQPVNIISGYDGDVVCTVEFEKVSARYIRVSFTGDGEICANELMLIYEETDSDKVTSGIEDITLPVSGNVTSDFIVTTELADGTKVEWTSSNTSVIRFVGNSAVVTRGAYDVSVTLTATVTSGSETASKSFIVVVSGTGVPGGNNGGNNGGGNTGGGMTLGGGNTGGGVTSAVGSNVPAITPNVPTTSFTDTASVPWAVEAINRLASIGVVNGTSATTFEPARSITREEFAAILYRGFGFDRVTASGSFSDVKSDAWYYDCVMQLSSMGIISGMGDGTFGTGKTITRQDMAVMIYRAAKAADAQFTAEGADFADADNIGSYAKDAVDALSGAQIINGVGNGNFNPTGNATRAEATVILSRIMDYIR